VCPWPWIAAAEEAARLRPTADDLRRGREWVGDGRPQRRLGAPSMPTRPRTISIHPLPPITARSRSRRPTRSRDAASECLAQLGETKDSPPSHCGIDYLLRPDDGRQLVRPLGHELHLRTWSVLGRARAAVCRSAIRRDSRAVWTVVKIQNSDGGWGEDGDSDKLATRTMSRRPAPPDAWALLALMAAGEGVEHPAVARGVAYCSSIRRRTARAEARFTRHRLPAGLLSALTTVMEILPDLARARYPQSDHGHTRAVLTGCERCARIIVTVGGLNARQG